MAADSVAGHGINPSASTEARLKTSRIFLLIGAVALYPLWFLYTANLAYIRLADLLRPLLVSLILLGGLYLLLARLLKDRARAALLAAAWWGLFSVYGHMYQALRGGAGALGLLGKHSLLAPLFLLLAVLIGVAITRSRRDFRPAVSAGALLVGIMLLVALAPAAARGLFTPAGAVTTADAPATRAALDLPLMVSADKPDIYYIVLDTYSRADVIEKEVGLDISPFLDSLAQRGFEIAGCSLSNYDSTRVSLTSSLNMDYLPALDARFTPENDNNAIMDAYIIHNKVRATLEAQGYTTYAFATGFNFTEWTDADVYIAPQPSSPLDAEVQPFEALWLKTTALRALFDTRPAALSGVLNWLGFPHGAHVRRQLNLLERLPALAAEPGPKFVFAHVILPHVPFVFRADGSVTTDDRYFREQFDQPVSQDYVVDGYRNQVEYLNGQLIVIVDQILRDSANPPVIILQGDHGLLYAEHNPILNAYYLPGAEPVEIPADITPVNTFRMIFNRYFQAGLPLFEDQAYASTYSAPYDFTPVTFACPVD